MVVGHHKKDWKALPNEGEFIGAVERMGIRPGTYGFPEFRRCEGLSQEQKKALWEEMQKKPMGLLRVWGPFSMGRNMLLSFLVYLAVSVLIAYIGWEVFPHGGAAGRPGVGKVVQVLGTVGVRAYTAASLPNDVWVQRSGREVVMQTVDGVAFGLITGAVFAGLWPA
jgi:hypothetical protein